MGNSDINAYGGIVNHVFCNRIFLERKREVEKENNKSIAFNLDIHQRHRLRQFLGYSPIEALGKGEIKSKESAPLFLRHVLWSNKDKNENQQQQEGDSDIIFSEPSASARIWDDEKSKGGIIKA